MHKKILLLAFVIFSSFYLCAPGSLQASLLNFLKGEHDTYEDATKDARSLKEQAEDDSLETNVKSALAPITPADAKIVVYSFCGHIYIVGEADADFAANADKKARDTDGVRNVTVIFYPARTASPTDDANIKSNVQKSLLTSTSERIYVQVWGGNVVLLGVLKSPPEIKNISKISGVKSVTTLWQKQK